MSLYSALSAGVTGLSAEASAMAGVADNIANINTVGYKGVSAQFSTLVGDGRLGSKYMAGGVTAAPHAMVSTAGVLQSSTSATDLAIDGQGFFMTRTGATKDSNVVLTRAGSFTTDKEGYLRNTAGLYLQGWRLDNEGNYNNNGSTDLLEPIRLGDLTGTAAPTSKIDVRINLQKSTAAYAGTTGTGTAGAYAVGDMATGKVAPNLSTPFSVYDAQGVAHDVTINVVKTADSTWQIEVNAVPASAVTATNGVLASGTLKFNGDGSLDKANSSGSVLSAISPTWTNGASSVPIKLGLGDDKGLNGFTEFDNVSGKISSSSDGGLLGTVSGASVDSKGVVSAVFSDGTRRAVFQLPVATVPNPDGLDRLAGNGFVVSSASGSFQMNAPGQLGAGNILGSKLEASTVDLAEEFTNMIRFQRAYSASSKVITTVDDMLQEVSNLKR